MRVLITGCSSGLGKSLSDIEGNHKIYRHFRDPEELPESNNFSKNIFGDINDKKFYDDFSIFLRDNDIDVVINNAGVYSSKPFIDFEDHEIINIISTNLTSQILLIKREIEHFKIKNGGRIININSLAGKFPTMHESIYSASKFGLRGFSKSLQLELLENNIYITDIFPGAMKTRMTESRKNYEDLMDTNEVARLILASLDHESMVQNEIVLRRK